MMASSSQEWDIVTGVGLTALAVAAARAMETASEDGLVDDPYAAAFVRAAEPPRPLPLAPPAPDETWAAMSSYMGVRSRFFDEYFAEAKTEQVVILAAGLDARAYRLDWTGRDVYEIDQPRVLEFKQGVLDAEGAQPRCRRHPVAVDLRDDWAAALTAAGFDPSRSTAWLAEGLLPYLPPGAEEGLFDTILALSAPGSHVAVEHLPDHGALIAGESSMKAAAEKLGVNMDGLLSPEPRRDPIAWLRSKDWAVEVATVTEVYERYERPLPPMFVESLAQGQLFVADLPG